MIFVWGKKPVYTHAGYVADFCQRIGMAWHLYYITVSKGELAGYQRSCCDCGTVLPVEVGHYKQLSAEQLPLVQLEQTTNPHLSIRHADALAAAARLREAPLLLDESERRRQLDAALRCACKPTRWTSTSQPPGSTAKCGGPSAGRSPFAW